MEFADLKDGISEWKSEFENVSRQLRGWANSLQNSEIEGQRYLNDRSRDQYERRQRRIRFDQELAELKRQREEKWKQEAAERNQERSGEDV